MRIKDAAFLTDQGKARRSNQDGILLLKRVPLYAVADGTGSDDAARTALLVVKDQAVHLTQRNSAVAATPNTTSRLAVGAFFQAAFQRANEALQRANEAGDGQRRVTTLCAATVVGPYAFVANVGDSRAYLSRDGQLRRLTNDHTLAALQLRRGDITLADFETSPFRTTLSQSAGMSPTLDVDVAEIRLMHGDQLLLCTNGLHRVVADDRIARCLEHGTLQERVDRLLAAANDAGAPDNLTAVLLEIEQDAPLAVRPPNVEQIVRDTFLFRGLADSQWLRVLPYLEETTVQTGEIVCRAGDTDAAFNILARGRVVVSGHAGERREIGAPGHFGALALASDGPQLDEVTAMEPAILYVMTRARFEQLVRTYPALGTRLALSLLEGLGDRLGILTLRLAHILELVQGRSPLAGSGA